MNKLSQDFAVSLQAHLNPLKKEASSEDLLDSAVNNLAEAAELLELDFAAQAEQVTSVMEKIAATMEKRAMQTKLAELKKALKDI